ncbi:MAG: hypothetical protein R3C03_21280 [Pirellulaceae bacterium]
MAADWAEDHDSVFQYLGFKRLKLKFFRVNPSNDKIGRMELLAAREPELLDSFDDHEDLYIIN